LQHVEGDKVVKPKELYATEMEKQFNNWLAKFDSLEALFASRHQLSARLQNDNWMEGHLKSEDKAQAFCAAQHFNPFERAL
jgi:hypothetical protein